MDRLRETVIFLGGWVRADLPHLYWPSYFHLALAKLLARWAVAGIVRRRNGKHNRTRVWWPKIHGRPNGQGQDDQKQIPEPGHLGGWRN